MHMYNTHFPSAFFLLVLHSYLAISPLEKLVLLKIDNLYLMFW